jgi:hypothetical protein
VFLSGAARRSLQAGCLRAGDYGGTVSFDMSMKDLSGGPDLYQVGNSASNVAFVLSDFITAGRATANVGHDGITNVETTVGGDVLIEAIAEAEREYPGGPIQNEDGCRTSESVTPGHTYKVSYVEF